MANVWKLIPPQELETWIPHPWSTQNVLLWEWGTPLEEGGDPFARRAILVYKRRGGMLAILGVATHPVQIERLTTLCWKWPEWRAQWNMSDAQWVPPSGSLDMDTLCAIISSIWRNESVLCFSREVERILCVCVDATGETQFERNRMALMEQWFWKCVVPQIGGNADALLDWLHWWDPEFVIQRVAPNSADLQAYALRHTTNVPRPEWFLKVPREDVVPYSRLPYHEGESTVRIAHLDLAEWIWFHVKHVRQQLMRIHYQISLDALPSQFRWLAQQLVWRKPDVKVVKSQKPEGDALVVDVEELCSTAAPCMQHVLRGHKFPANAVRNGLVRALNAAHIAEPVVASVLLDIHRREDKGATAESTQRRFDHRYQMEQGYAPPKCEYIKEGCPFRGAPHKRAEACHTRYKEAHPEVKMYNSDYRHFGPHKWWLFAQRKDGGKGKK